MTCGVRLVSIASAAAFLCLFSSVTVKAAAAVCDSSRCKNGGVCQSISSELCFCPFGFTGRFCETEEQPPSIRAPHIEVSHTSTLVASDVVTMTCLMNYRLAFISSFHTIVDNMNAMVNAGQMCINSSFITLYAADVLMSSPGSSTNVQMSFNMYVMPPAGSQTETMTGVANCGWQSGGYLEDFSHWFSPIIRTPPGCPSIDFVPMSLGDSAVSWVCADD